MHQLQRPDSGGFCYNLECVEDGEAGWNKLVHAPDSPASYDLLIIDNEMPKLSGVDLIKKLHHSQITLPIILASGSASLDVGDFGVAAVLRKPFHPADLLQTVKDVLSRQN